MADLLLLHSAGINDRRGCLEAFELGADPNACQEDMVAAVNIVAEKGFKDFISALVTCTKMKKKTLDLNKRTIFGNTPLDLSIVHDHLGVLEELLKAGADPNQLHTYNRRPLHLAALHGSLQATVALLQHRALVNVVDCFDQTPLSLAMIGRNSIALVKHLLKAGSNPNHRHKSTMPVLSLAVLACTEYSHLKNISLLVKWGALVGAKDYIKHETALHRAAQTGYIRCIDYLLKKGADVRAKNICGQTPLNVAITFRNMRAAHHLYKLEEEKEEEEFNAIVNRESSRLSSLKRSFLLLHK